MLYAPLVMKPEEIRALRDATTKPLNVLALPGMTVREIADAGGQRISVGSQLAWVAVASMTNAAEQIRDVGDFAAFDVRVPVKEWFAAEDA